MAAKRKLKSREPQLSPKEAFEAYEAKQMADREAARRARASHTRPEYLLRFALDAALKALGDGELLGDDRPLILASPAALEELVRERDALRAQVEAAHELAEALELLYSWEDGDTTVKALQPVMAAAKAALKKAGLLK